MNKILLGYIIINYLKKILIVTSIFYLFGLILNLFQELEFFRDVDESFATPLALTAIYVPSIIIEILPFIIFVSSMWLLINMRDKRELLIFKVYGFSNMKIFFIISLVSFIFGWIVLSFFNPISSVMTKYYEKTKSRYARDVDHLISFNKNGLWIKETIDNSEERIIYAKKDNDGLLEDLTIFVFNQNFDLKEKIVSKQANIKDFDWILSDVSVIKILDEISVNKFEVYKIKSIYNHEKISNLFKNTHTLSFIELITKHEELKRKGYNKEFLFESLNKMITLPFFLVIMAALASILTMHTLKDAKNFRFILVGIIVCVIIFYFKDLSNALGQTNRIPLIISSWIPVVSLGIFGFIGILQINEK